MSAIIMLGFHEHEAVDYARAQGWRIRRGSFRTLDDRLVVYVLGAHPSEASRFAGLEVARDGGIIYGKHAVCAEVEELALSRAKLRFDRNLFATKTAPELKALVRCYMTDAWDATLDNAARQEARRLQKICEDELRKRKA